MLDPWSQAQENVIGQDVTVEVVRDIASINLIGCTKVLRYVRKLDKSFFTQVVFDP